MPRKQNKKKKGKKEEKEMSLQTFYINANLSDAEDNAIQKIKDYMQARKAKTAKHIMCEFIDEYLPIATKAWKDRNKKNKAS